MKNLKYLFPVVKFYENLILQRWVLFMSVPRLIQFAAEKETDLSSYVPIRQTDIHRKGRNIN